MRGVTALPPRRRSSRSSTRTAPGETEDGTSRSCSHRRGSLRFGPDTALDRRRDPGWALSAGVDRPAEQLHRTRTCASRTACTCSYRRRPMSCVEARRRSTTSSCATCARPPPEALDRHRREPAGAGHDRSLTVGSDCAIGKMTVALGSSTSRRGGRGVASIFVPTGQTRRIAIAGLGGIAVDAVVADFIAGAPPRRSSSRAPTRGGELAPLGGGQDRSSIDLLRRDARALPRQCAPARALPPGGADGDPGARRRPHPIPPLTRGARRPPRAAGAAGPRRRSGRRRSALNTRARCSEGRARRDHRRRQRAGLGLPARGVDPVATGRRASSTRCSPPSRWLMPRQCTPGWWLRRGAVRPRRP